MKTRGKGKAKVTEELTPTTEATEPAVPTPAPTQPGRFEPELPVDAITPTPYNPRHFREDEAFADLVGSVLALGVLEPVLVREVRGTFNGFELLAGERRWRASRAAGRTTIPAIVRELTDPAALHITVTENLHRQDLTPLEEARGVRSLLESGLDREEIAGRLGKTAEWVARRASLVNLLPEWVARFEDPTCEPWGRATIRIMELIARYPEAHQRELLGRHYYGPLTSAAISEWLSRNELRLASAVFSRSDSQLVPGCPACVACPKRSGAMLDLFDHSGPKDDQCLDRACWTAKSKAAVLARLAAHPEYRVAAFASQVQLLRDRFAGTVVADCQVVRVGVDTETRVKKGEQGAVPLFLPLEALMGGGDPTAIVQYWRLKEAASAKAAAPASASPAQAAEIAADEKLEERIATYQRRRLNYVAEAVHQLLIDGKFEISRTLVTADRQPARTLALVAQHEVLVLASTVGLRNAQPWVSGQLNQMQDARSIIESGRHQHTAVANAAVERIWELVVSDSIGPRLKHVYDRSPANGGVSNDLATDEVITLCRILRLDFEGLFQLACEAIPYPKAWRAKGESLIAKQQAAQAAATASAAPAASSEDASDGNGYLLGIKAMLEAIRDGFDHEIIVENRDCIKLNSLQQHRWRQGWDEALAVYKKGVRAAGQGLERADNLYRTDKTPEGRALAKAWEHGWCSAERLSGEALPAAEGVTT